MRMDGEIADIITKLDPSRYEKFVRKVKGKSVMYVRLKKALYGTLQAALLFWKDLSQQLIEWGFDINPYDWCVANKEIDGKQCTILWHVDDLKISHVDPDVVTDILEKLQKRYGTKERPIKIKRGKIHEYLGMTLDYSEDGKVKIDMKDYVNKILEEVPADMDGTAKTPAADHLFETNEDATKLNKEKADLFHHHVAQLLFLAKRGRPDILTAVSFLCTRVKEPDEDDYKKLARTICYLRGSTELVLTLEGDKLLVPEWWVDASFAIHNDMRGHTGAMLSLGKGAAYASSTKHKINGRSSTDTEVIAVDDTMPQLLWTKYFLEAQGYTVDTTLHQDNQSAIRLESNGRASSTKRTRHINVRYFFVKDHVEQKNLKIQYCPTAEMIADFFTKPLQGQLFIKLRNLIMNISDDSHE